ncbi:MAG: acyl-CoA dehydrogenase family protein [Trueperaceae bacterium]
MNFLFGEEHREFKGQVVDFFESQRDESWGTIDRESDSFRALGMEMDKRLVERGWWVLHWPEMYGGGGGDFVSYAILREAEGYFRVPTGGGHGRYIVGSALMKFASEELKDEVLPQIAKAETVLSLGYTEPEAGSDLGSLRATALRDGDNYIINGTKAFITYGHFADQIFLAARTDPSAPKKHQGVSLFLVPLDSDGVVIESQVCLTGHRVNLIHFNDVAVNSGRLVGTEHQGFYHMADALNYERSGVQKPAIYRRQLEAIVELSKQNGTFGQSAESITGLLTMIEAWRMLCWRVVLLQGRGDSPSWEASQAELYRKLVNPEFGRLISIVCGSEYLSDQLSPLLKWWIREGTNNHGQGGRNVTMNAIGRRGLKLPRAGSSEAAASRKRADQSTEYQVPTNA